ncbi:MAG TPA: sigma-70 family RNA polymerase sigma factor [Pyrinomonadaceae bacterium]|nr:sigma-70 family RNA polymerase sigma factor [Pyrinomonadaceae bacterium]
MLDQIVVTREQQLVKDSVDAPTIAACQQGDREALRDLFEVYKDRVYSIAIYSLSGDEMGAADVTQQVFLKLMTRINQFRGDSEFATWLYRLVVNTCHDEFRKRRRFVSLADSLLHAKSTGESPRARYARKELSGSVQQAIAELKPKLRWPILLKYVEGMSYEEIAGVLGCSKGTVASRLNRAHKALSRRLGHLQDQI